MLAFLGLVAVAIGIASFPVWRDSMGLFLLVDQPHVRADAIVVLAGNSPGRMRHAQALFDAGHAPIVVASDERLRSHGMDTSWSEMVTLGVVKPPVSDQALVILKDPPPESTIDEARRSAAVLNARGAKSAILVTDHFHSRRALLLFQAVYRRGGIEVTSSPNTSRFDLSRWWASPTTTLAVLEEYVKLLAYLPQGAYF